LVRHFDGFEIKLLPGRTVTWKAGQERCPVTGMSVGSGHSLTLSTLQEVAELTESGLRLYHQFKSGPPFRFARVAWEAGLVPVAEVSECLSDMGNGYRFDFESVVDEALLFTISLKLPVRLQKKRRSQ